MKIYLFEDNTINADDFTLSTKNIDANGKISFADGVIERAETSENVE